MTLRQLRAFLVTARTGTFTAAAKSLGIAQASVSELVRTLEDEYGTVLFVRGGRKLVLTAAGVALLPHAEQSLAAADGGVAALKSVRSLTGGVATFGVLRNASYYLLSDLAEEFHRRFPEVRIRLVGMNSVEVAAEVAEGRLEAGLVVLPIDADGLRVTPLVRDEVLYASAVPERVASAVTIEQFAHATVILYDAHYGWKEPTRRQLAERAQLAGHRIEPLIEVEQVESALGLVRRGIGDTVISRAVATSSACPPEVRVVGFEPPLYDTIALVQRESGVLSPATRELARMAQQMLLRHRVADAPARDGDPDRDQ
ncbi:LysR family transcriptional regulator [Nocardia rhamnosiphila]|uniref:LysR family transcriptional regulator n=1 Tax=Nocardia rhamnosiphila TaxID=426716 RepID=UPI0033C4F702